MTTYSYTLVLNDTEMIALEQALHLMLTHCEHKLATEPGAPYYAWRDSVKRMQARLYANARQTSGNQIDPETGEYRIWIDAKGPTPDQQE